MLNLLGFRTLYENNNELAKASAISREREKANKRFVNDSIVL